MNTTTQIGKQAKATYENYKKTREFRDVGMFLQYYVNEGGIVTKDATRNNKVNVSDISASLNDTVMYREGTSFKTEVPNTTYYLDFHEDGDFRWGTGHTTDGLYLTVAEVTTDGNGNVASIKDTAEPRGGFRLKSEFGLEDYTRKSEFNEYKAETATELTKVSDTVYDVSQQFAMLDIDINRANCRLAPAPLIVPVYIGDEVVHPSVLFFSRRWNGYRYWMAMTPYHQSNNQYENPSIVVSNDGINWIAPPNLTNPLVPAPGSGGYNSDPVIFMDKDGVTMHLVYRQFGTHPNPASERLYLMSSKDGISWTEREMILGSDSNVSRPISPAIVWDGSRYIMWHCDVTSNDIYIRYSSDLRNWSNANAVNIASLPSGRRWWHIDVKYFNGVFWSVIQDASNSGGSNGNLYFATSTDGVNWERTVNPILFGAADWQSEMYKSTIVPVISNDGFEFALWYGARGNQGWKIGYTHIKTSQSKFNQDNRMRIVSAVSRVNPYVVGDSFNRPDTSDGLGIADSGTDWAGNVGTMVIKSGYASPFTSANTRAVIDAGVSDMSVSVDIIDPGVQAWVVARFINSDNNIRAGFAGGSGDVLKIQRVQSGSIVELYTSGQTRGFAGDNIELELKGDKIKLYLNGKLIGSVTDNFNISATKAGLQATNVNAKFSNFSIRKT